MLEMISSGIVKILSQQLFDKSVAIKTSKPFNVFGWRLFAMAQSAGSGVLLVAIPGLGYVGLAADIASLFSFMAVSALGVGAILARDKGLDPHNVIKKDDYEDILAVWVNAPELLSEIGVKAVKFGIKGGTKLSAFAATLPSKGVAKGAAKSVALANKVATKILAKIGAKGTSPMLPVVGPALNGGVNGWFIADIIGTAKEYYQAKLEYIAENQSQSCPYCNMVVKGPWYLIIAEKSQTRNDDALSSS